MRFIEIISICACGGLFMLGIYELAKGDLTEKDLECLERLHFC